MPIETTVMTGHQAGASGYRIDRARYELADLHLEPDEMRALQVAVAAVRPTQGREALWKLGLDTIEGEAAGDVAVTATVPELPGLPALRDASARRCAVGSATAARTAGSIRTGCCCAPGSGTSWGATTTHDELRTYRVDRIEGDVTVARRRDVRAPRRLRPAHGLPVRPQGARQRRAGRGRRRARRRGARRRRRPRARARASARRVTPTGRSTSRCRAPTSRRSARGCSGCSTTPSCCRPRTSGPRSSRG